MAEKTNPVEPRNEEDLLDAALMMLGEPAIRVNVTRDQGRLAVKQALKRFRDYHVDGTSHVWMRELVTPEVAYDRGFKVPDEVTVVVKVLGIQGRHFNIGAASGAFNSIYDIVGRNALFSTARYDKVDIYLYQREMAYFTEILQPEEMFRYSEVTRRVQIDTNYCQMAVGQYVMYEAFVDNSKIDTRTFENDWLVKYSSALVQRQWGQNLAKLKGVRLPGGSEMNYEFILGEAKERIKELEDELFEMWSASQTIVVIG